MSKSGEELRDSWRSEFKALGSDGVRRAIALGRWPQDKLSAARQWLQLDDIRQWQQHASAGPQRSSKELRRWTPYFIAAALVLFAALRLFRLMRHGV